VLHALDDDIANAVTVADLLRTFPNAPTRAIAVRACDLGLKDLGHMNWFRSSHQAAWPLMAQAVRGTLA
ncbi:MAG: alpha/beta hydrolase, partial [Betaproteobacteria bacterium]